VIFLSGCASDKLALAPSAAVDLSGRWKLNEADSDDPQRLIQAQFNAAANAQNSPAGGGSGGRGRQGGRGGPGGFGGPGGPGAPVMPSVSVMSESLRWPGKELEIKQVAGVVAFTSEGINQLCQPSDADKKRHHGSGSDRDGRPEGRDEPPGGRDVPPPRCGWADKVLVVQAGDPDADHPPYEESYSLSDDGSRLIEVVGFKGGRSNGFTMSRVWDRIVQ